MKLQGRNISEGRECCKVVSAAAAIYCSIKVFPSTWAYLSH